VTKQISLAGYREDVGRPAILRWIGNVVGVVGSLIESCGPVVAGWVFRDVHSAESQEARGIERGLAGSAWRSA
jgi:hypothetical protein